MSILNIPQSLSIRFYLGMKVVRKGQTRALIHNGFIRQQHEQNGGAGWLEFRPQSEKAGVVQAWVVAGNNQQEVDLKTLLELTLPGVSVSELVFIAQVGNSEELETILEGNTGIFVDVQLTNLQAESDVREAYRGGAEIRIHLIDTKVTGVAKPPRKDLVSLGEALEGALSQLPTKKRGVEGLLDRYQQKQQHVALQATAVAETTEEVVEAESLEDIVL